MRLRHIFLAITLIAPTIVVALAAPIIDDELALEPENGQFFNPFLLPSPFPEVAFEQAQQLMLLAEPIAVPGIAPFGPPPLQPGKIMRRPGPPWQLHRMFFNPWTWDRFLWPARGLDGRPYNPPIPPELVPPGA